MSPPIYRMATVAEENRPTHVHLELVCDGWARLNLSCGHVMQARKSHQFTGGLVRCRQCERDLKQRQK